MIHNQLKSMNYCQFNEFAQTVGTDRVTNSLDAATSLPQFLAR